MLSKRYSRNEKTSSTEIKEEGTGGGGGVPVTAAVQHSAEKMLKCCFTSTETVGLLGTGAQDVHLDFHTAPELCRLRTDEIQGQKERMV